MLDNPISTLNGIGAKRAQNLEKLRVYTIRDLLFFLPRDYEDYREFKNVCDLCHGDNAALRLYMKQKPKHYYIGGLSLVSLEAEDETGSIKLIWFNQPYRKNMVIGEGPQIVCGKADYKKGLRLINPSIIRELPGLLPVYPLVKGLTQKVVMGAVRQALNVALDELDDDLPEHILKDYSLVGIREALKGIHSPADLEELARARQRLSFEDMLYYILAVELQKKERRLKPGISFNAGNIKDEFVSGLPFKLTCAQSNVMNEIAADMQNPSPMNRLIQGDVGSGKTVLAFFAMNIAAKNGYQAVLMAPTEIVARQHFEKLHEMYGDAAVQVYGGMTKKQKNEAYEKIRTGQAAYITGTHALLQEGLEFFKLGLVITDEQHRFGVRQRAVIASRSDRSPDVLIMSATPIPRTLSMLMYGDLEVSIVNELPPGRKPVSTKLVPSERRMDMYRFIKEQIQSGKQAYVVCPLVDQSQILEVKSATEVHAELTKAFPEINIGLLHGKMGSAKKDELISAFRKGDIDMLVSTTVVEVGVDVPNATVMAIENSDRFGLAQLHQLRGRVGRGALQSYCFLLGVSSVTSRKRTAIMSATNDGFIIAQKDLDIRGPGDFMGTRQHGIPSPLMERTASNMELLLMAKKAADELIKEGRRESTQSVFSRAEFIYEQRIKDIANN